MHVFHQTALPADNLGFSSLYLWIEFLFLLQELTDCRGIYFSLGCIFLLADVRLLYLCDVQVELAWTKPGLRLVGSLYLISFDVLLVLHVTKKFMVLVSTVDTQSANRKMVMSENDVCFFLFPQMAFNSTIC